MVTSPWRERREVWREKRKVRIFGRGKWNSSPILTRQWWRQVRLSLSLSLYYRKRGSAEALPIIGSAEALPILCVRYFRWERDRYTDRDLEIERDGSDVTIFALKLAMNLHFPLPKIRTIGNEFTLSLAKNSHFSFLPSHSPSLPLLRGHHCGAEIRKEFILSIAKFFFALFVPPLSNGRSRATSDRKPKTNDQILASPILFFPSKKWIKLIPKTIGNRKRDCAWGGSGW